jgi:hypothetical protein
MVNINSPKRKAFKKVSYVISKLSNLSAQSIAQYMVENKITISKLEKDEYPSNIIDIIKPYFEQEKKIKASNTIKQYQRNRFLTEWLFTKNLIKRRIQRGEYNEEEIEILQDHIIDMEEHILPSYDDDDPHFLISKINVDKMTRILEEDLIQQISNPSPDI